MHREMRRRGIRHLMPLEGPIADDHTGAWSSDEQAHFIQTMQDLNEHAKHPARHPISGRRSLNDWAGLGPQTNAGISSKLSLPLFVGVRVIYIFQGAALSKNVRRIRWRYADSKTLINRYVLAQCSELF